MRTLEEVRDFLLTRVKTEETETKKIDDYANGVLDMFNELKKDLKKETK